MADSLEDDFVVSDIESIGEQVASDASSNGREGFESSNGRERKEGNGVYQDGEDEAERRARKKRKMKQQDKSRKARKAADQGALGPGQVAIMPPDMQADHLRKLMKSCKQFSQMSDMELDEIAIQESMIVDGTALKIERVQEKIGEFISSATPAAIKSIEEVAQVQPGRTGQPAVLVITGNAQRAADLAKHLRKLSRPSLVKVEQKALPVGKLFARHFKLSEQQDFLKANVCPIAVGTPQRLHDLLQLKDETGSLKVDNLNVIILDASWTDAKMRSLLDGVETKQALCTFLADNKIQDKLKAVKKEDRAMILLF